MVELRNALIISNKKDKEEINLVLDNSTHILSYEKKELYQFFLLRNQALDKGEFLVDNVSIVPLTDENNSLYVLGINSACFVTTAVFLVTKDSKKQKMKEINSSMMELKENKIPDEKIPAIFDRLINLGVSYICINFANSTNKEYLDIITKCLSNFTNLCAICYDDKKVEKVNSDVPSDNGIEEPNYLDDEFYSINIGEDDEQIDQIQNKKHKNSKLHDKAKNDFGKRHFNNQKTFMEFKCLTTNKKNKFLYYLKDNYSTLLFLLIPMMGSIGSALLSPAFFASDNAGFGVTFLLTSIFCLIIHLINSSDIYDFIDFKDDYTQERYKYSFLATLISIVLGTGLGIAFFLIVRMISKTLLESDFKFAYAIPAIVVFLIVLAIPLYIKWIRKLIRKIVLLFKGKNKEN